MKLALWRNLKCGYDTSHGDGLEGSEDFVRLSEYVEVDFPMLPAADVTEKQVSALDREIREVTTEFAEKLQRLKNMRANLLALTHEVAA